MRILVFGDSITLGLYDFAAGGWAERLRRDFMREEADGTSNVWLYNLGIGGETSEKLLVHLEGDIVARDRHDGLMVVIAIGTNDSYEKSGMRKVDELAFRQNLLKITATVKQYTQHVLLLGLSGCDDALTQPTTWDGTLFYDTSTLKQYEQIIEAVASAEKTAFVPLWQVMNTAAQKQTVYFDGLHPNDEGHRVIYEAVRAELQQLLG